MLLEDNQMRKYIKLLKIIQRDTQKPGIWSSYALTQQCTMPSSEYNSAAADRMETKCGTGILRIHSYCAGTIHVAA